MRTTSMWTAGKIAISNKKERGGNEHEVDDVRMVTGRSVDRGVGVVVVCHHPLHRLTVGGDLQSHFGHKSLIPGSISAWYGRP